ncbi:MAG: GIY-YIG nuclease family protein [Patescibacteria group bacterium]|nr:GIY-YIG nuclease family protein [Patescibacteria group bacterium]
MDEANHKNGVTKQSPDRWSDHNKKVSVIYLIYQKPNGDGIPFIKIGISREHHKRIKKHKKKKGTVTFKTEVLGKVRGDSANEGFIHRYFNDCLVEDSKEEFYPRPKLLDWIRWLRDQFFVSVPDCNNKDSPPVEDLEDVCFDSWCPRPDRVKPWPINDSLFDDYGELGLPPREITGDDFYTPDLIMESARRALGGIINLDPASHAVANQVVRAERIFTKGDNGLNHRWSGTVWLNPPFGS